MKTAHLFSIDFLVRKCKGDKKSAFVYAWITVDKRRVEISLKEKIELINWHTKSERARGKTTEAKALNEHISNVEFLIRQHYWSLLDTLLYREIKYRCDYFDWKYWWLFGATALIVG